LPDTGQSVRKNALKIGTKITLLSFSLVVVTVLVLIGIVAYQKGRLAPQLGSYLDDQAFGEGAKLVKTISDTCAAAEADSNRRLDHSLGVVHGMLDTLGAVSVATTTVNWDAENQVSHQKIRVDLPKFMAGTTWFGQNFSMDTPSALVDDVKRYTACEATVFQRMNDAGDMLRVSTSVKKADGTRAVGTFIPAVNADNTPNAIIATVLKGQTFHGRAMVVDAWHNALYEPIWDPTHQKVLGMVFVGMNMTETTRAVRESIMKVTLGKTGYIYVLGTKGDLRGHYIVSQNGKRDGEDMWNLKDAGGNMLIQDMITKGATATGGKTELMKYSWLDAGASKPRDKWAVMTYFESWDWLIGASGYNDEYKEAQASAMDTLTRLVWWTILVAIALTLAGLVISYRISRGIVEPINVLARTAEQIAKGDNTARANVVSDDEIGQLGNAFNSMLVARIKAKEDTDDYRRLQEGIQQLLRVTSDASDGDMTVRAPVTEGVLGNVSDAVNLMLENVGDLLKEVQTVANRVASSATEIQASSEQLSQGSVKQTGEIINTTTAVQEMAANIESVSNNATSANEAATRALQAADVGAKAVQQVVEGMDRIRQNVQAGAKKIKRLGERSMEISTIVNTIGEISSQTNMLALNAAIEAARAGEHGRGFTVVAEEVRKLAERTASATKEIEKLIAGIQAETNESVSAMEQQTTEVEAESKVVEGTGAELSRIRESSSQSAELINEINLAAKQQVRGAAGVVKAMETVSTIAQQAQTGAVQTKRATESLASLSSELLTSLSKFKISTNGNGHGH